MELRNAKFEDLPEILGIYNEVIANSNSVYLEDGVNLENREKWFRSKVASKFPVLVAHENNEITNYGGGAFAGNR